MSPVFLALLPTAHAAEAMSLEGALTRALEVSESLALVEASRDRADGQIWSARAGWLPTVNGGVNYQHQFSSQFDGLFGAPAPATPTTPTTTTGTPTGGAGQDEGDAPLNPFAVQDTWTVSLQGQLGLYGGGRTGATYKIATLQRDLTELDEETTRAGLALDVASAYYDVVLADRILEISASALSQAEATLKNTELAGEVGRTSEFDVLRARVEVENQRVQLIQSERNLVRTRLYLANLLNLPAAEFETTEDLENPVAVDQIALRLVGTPPADADRAAVSQAEAAVEISEASVTLARAAGLPGAGLIGNVAFIGWSDNVLPPTKADEWRDAVNVQLQVNVPIFNGGVVRGQIHSAQAGVVEAETRLQQTREVATSDQLDAAEALRAAEAQFAATSGTVAQADRAYEIADVRFREGVSTQVELADARLLRQRALANRAQAARDLQVARTRVALLPWLPLR
jgi:outer membrane protein